MNHPGVSPPELSSYVVAKPTFTANLAGTYVFALQVEDSNLAISNTQNSITTITITPDNRSPICNAGQNQNTLIDPFGSTTATVILDGSASFGPVCIAPVSSTTVYARVDMAAHCLILM